ncbi:aromatic ring-hydroxylating dioxygenase subunit alpha [Pusillimonas caeni]|uniref:aromatic ring-hydroxylating dioxygenase subunit alpha n=1 Tax=Pusillimonas caeni TaxID=1348472 RepID=UPI000E59AB8F|nr:aromatic ring-hydroxylating dioxygenase subunit alpha [Pusillimonas caeni]TFL13051.1 aromatic ring-hydroxylating dioxygenase subunit alpha [Pusillimonas caeni]
MSFIRNAWYVACWSSDVKLGELFHRQILDEAVVFYRTQEGETVALQDRCPHRFIPLHMGKLVDGRIQCAYHGLEFDCTGRCVNNPHGDGRIPSAARVKSFPTVERHTFVWIWLGDGKPDISAIPDYGVLDSQAGYKTSGGYLHMNANYQLMADNLMDLSHITYVHDGYLGSPEQAGAAEVVESSERAVQANRWMPNISVPGIFDLLYRQDGQAVDMWTNMKWTAPSCFLLDTGVHRVGGQKEERGWYYGVHILTPETEHSTHYYFAVAMPVATALGPDEDRRYQALRRFAFEEQDKPILEAQQAALTGADFWEMKPVLLSVDAGSVRMRRIIEHMLEEERSNASTSINNTAVAD